MAAEVVQCRLRRHGQGDDTAKPVRGDGRSEIRLLGAPVVADHHRLGVAPEGLVRREDVSHQRFGRVGAVGGQRGR